MNNLHEQKKTEFCKIGILGGTFDPPHRGHIQIAQRAIETLSLDRLIFLPAGIPPHKVKENITASEIREQMVHMVVAENKKFAISTYDLYRSGPSYTIDTLKYFNQLEGDSGTAFFWLIGMDNLIQLPTWRSYHELTNYAKIVIYPRGNIQPKLISFDSESYIFLPGPEIDISSSKIREMVAGGQEISQFVTPVVEKIIRENNLYSMRD